MTLSGMTRTYSQHGRATRASWHASDTDPVYGATTIHPRRRPRLYLLLAGLVVLALAVPGVVVVRWATDDSRRDYLSTDGWPTNGQGAYALGTDTAHASAQQEPAPIASLAKVMTAYLVLRAAPLTDGSDGPSLRVSAADVADTAHRRSLDQSLVPVEAGERLTERDALMAVLLPSANNVAAMVTRYVDTSLAAFVDRMNATARRLGMRHTTYTDPSGYDQGTVSTAADQLILARTAGADPTLARMMATRSYRIPVAGTIHNTDTLLGSAGFVGMKTGSDDAAGGCFMFHARRTVDGRSVDLWGVVLGQHGHNLVDAGLYAARQLADRVAPM